MYIVGSVEHERPSLQQMAKWRNLPGVVHWGLHVVLPRGRWYHWRFFSFFVTFVLLSSSRVCLPVVSRLLGLTLRPSAPVCSCHRVSLTRVRLALAQEAVRVSSASSRLFFCSSMCLVISDNLRGKALQAMRTYEGPASLVTSWSFECSLQD